jgi:glycosyltransferase involved in cell wall biosynthesis
MASVQRTLLFLLPGTTQKYFCGGLVAEMKAMKLAQQATDAAIVTYRQREPDKLFLPDLLAAGPRSNQIFVVSWGFDVPKLVKQLSGHHVMYHAHSSNYGFRLDSRVPIVTVSRNTLGYWGQQAPHSPLYYLPNEISPEFVNRHQDRDIDVLVQVRKTSSYLRQSLIPALSKQCNLQVLDGFVEDLAGLFNRSKVYLYDSAEYWAIQGLTEGFGLPPLEAIACGCQVFSSVNHALADYLDPGFNCQKIAVYDTGYDVQRILRSLNQPPAALPAEFLQAYREESIVQRWQSILPEINDFFDYQEKYSSDISPLNRWRVQTLWWQSKLAKIKVKLRKS